MGYASTINKSGQSLIELIIAIALGAMIIPVLFFAMTTSTNSKAQQSQSMSAGLLLKEGIEAVRSVKEGSWSNISTNGSYHPVVVSDQWTLAPNSENIDQYTRSINLDDVFRDSSGNITTSGGALDPETKKAIVIVSWTTPYPSSLSSTIYLTNY